MNKKFFIAFFCVFSVGSAHAESLSEVYALAMQNEYRLMAAQSAYLAGQEAETIARAPLLPKLTVDGTWTRSETNRKLESSNPFAPSGTNVADSNSPGYIISLTQPLIDFSAFHNYKRGAITEKMAKLEFARARSTLLIRTVDTYFQTLTAGAKLAAAQSAEEAFRQRMNAAKLKYDVGSARRSDYLEAQAALDSAVADSLVAKNNLNVLFDTLKVITGKDHTELTALPENFIANFPMPLDFNQWADAATKNNIDINVAKLRVADAYQVAQARASDHLPKLSGRVTYSDGYDHRTYSSAIPDQLYQQGWTASLTLSVPIYSGGGTSAAARDANYRYLEQVDSNNAVNREVMQSTHSVYLSVIAGVAAVNARKAAITSSQSALEFAQKGYDEGIVNILNLLDAQKAVYQAAQNYSDAVYSYLIAGLRLKAAAGLLSPKDIEDLSRQLDDSRKVQRPSLD